MTEKTDGFWFAAVRRRENIKILKSKDHPPIPVSVGGPLTSGDPETALSKDLQSLSKKNEDHLKLPQVKIKAPVSKLAILGMILGFLIMGFLFFIGGFMLCYSFFPPYRSPSLITEENASSSASVSSGNDSYAAHQQALATGDEGGGTNKGAMLTKIEEQSSDQARRITHDSIIQRTTQLNNKIKQTLGWQIGTVIEPATLGIAEALSGNVENKIGPHQSNPVIEGKPAEKATPGAGGNAPAAGGSQASKNADSGTNENVYSIEVQVLNDSDVAYSLQQELKQRGMDAYIVRYTVNDKLHYAVRFGGFKSFKAAQEAMGVFRVVWRQPARVVIIDKNEDRMGS
ncbi:SPOR domain-containing protein [Candidatus Nucleicultrix amoebiphila]|uniref:SPOR domain-containing protein n=1 Tax=Candidatus Nucleicultrix amoebiphila FS5 TaxID=1414854 RepID=A0A1W6N5M9_9PROT|nr:SPOR domain-containing protein [Candidatus Nucleicultrix amoebiphila]ARN85185.1 hypothetical protein GQ61_07705 [Candidatus Nucleicultrix amoebiphila FS5]